ncbi:MAG: formyl transferase [Deltaproteobacteria bacterium]|nr:formyl transferase [Deltaproteobacteria bacterium]
MTLTPIFDPQAKGRGMRIAAFMSGSGTNVIRLLEREKELEKETGGSPFHIIFIFSDRSDGGSAGEKIALDKGIPYFSYDIRKFYSLKGLKRTALTPATLSARREFDSVASRLIKAFDIDIIALAGYMSYLTLHRCVNVHPADLSILTSDGKRKYVGDYAVGNAIANGETSLRSSTIWIDAGVDTGPILMVSNALKVTLPSPLPELLKNRKAFKKVVNEHQKRLKEIGDWTIFPQTVEMIARGRFSLDENNNVYVDGQPVPEGYRLEE